MSANRAHAASVGLVALHGPARLLVQTGQEPEDILFVRELRVA